MNAAENGGVLLPPSPTRTAEPVELPPPSGNDQTREARPFEVNSKPIAWIVTWGLVCLVIGQLGLLACLAYLVGWKDASIDQWLVWLYGIHTVGVFALLLTYLGVTLKLTSTSAETGR